MKHYWWILPLIPTALIMYSNLSYLDYFITSMLVVFTLFIFKDSVEKRHSEP